MSLAYNNNYITFNFIGINTNQPKRVRYQYKLEGIEENWSALSSENYATYGNLPHGKYIFKVKSKNGQGYWSEPIEYAFEIRPPWWKTWWFRITLSILILTLLFGIYRWRTASLRTRQKQLEKDSRR
ncbi:MAG: hypothetical protein IPM77_15155 [Crocinitomicaceae bacterium]|nr:hypothetical protein [Crocinitomicaceae bacterium]